MTSSTGATGRGAGRSPTGLPFCSISLSLRAVRLTSRTVSCSSKYSNIVEKYIATRLSCAKRSRSATSSTFSRVTTQMSLRFPEPVAPIRRITSSARSSVGTPRISR